MSQPGTAQRLIVRINRLFIGVCLLLALTSCASLSPRFEKPVVNLASIKMGASTGLEQRFILGLRVINPNDRELPIRGMSYTLQAEGFDLGTGVAHDIEPVPAYGEALIPVEVGLSLFNSLRFVQQFLQKPLQQVHYQLNTRLDTGSAWLPKIVISESGSVALGAPSAR